MSQLSKQDLKAENQLQFPNNNNGAITPSHLRAFNVDMIDSTVNQTNFDSFSSSVASDINELESWSSSLSTGFVSTASFNTYTASNNDKWNTLGAQSGSWITESESGSFLITASFNNGTRNLTFTKGDATTFAVTIPDVSGSIINTGSFATTGSNTFNGGQLINLGSGETVRVVGAGEVKIEPNASETLLNVINTDEAVLRLISAGQALNNIYDIQVSGIGNATGSLFIGTADQTFTYAKFAPNGLTVLNNKVDISGSLSITGSMSASIPQGFTYVGDANGRTALVATSSFGSVISTGSFLTTASVSLNTITFTKGDASTFNITVDTGSGGGGGTTFARPSIETISGSVLITANGFTSGAVNLLHISASAQNQANLLFKNTNNAGSTIVSGSLNIYANGSAPAAGRLNYLENSNIFLNDSGFLPTVTASVLTAGGFYPRLRNNMWLGTGPWTINTNAFASSSVQAGSFNNNLFLGSTGTTLNTLGNTSGIAFSHNILAQAGVTINAPSRSLAQIAAGASGSNVVSFLNNAAFGGTITYNGPVSSSTHTISGNSVQGTATFNLQSGSRAYSISSNGINGTFTINDNTVFAPTLGSTNFYQNNIINGTATINNRFSSSFNVGNNNINTYTISSDADLSGISTAAQRTQQVSGNGLFGTLGNNIYFSGSAGGTTLKAFVSNLMAGNSLSASVIYTGGGEQCMLATTVLGHGLNVFGTATINAANPAGLGGKDGGSAFIGRYNATDGNRANTAETVFAVGTGNSGSAGIVRKTGFLIDSGSNTFIEGTLNVSGASSLNGNLIITGSLTASLQQGYVWVGNANGITTTVATSSFGGGGAAFPFTGNAVITGSLGISGSMFGGVISLSVVSSTASVDFSAGNMFTLTLPSASTHINPTNIRAGQTVNIQITQPTPGTGSVTFPSNVKFAGGNDYQATTTGSAIDMLTLVSYDGTNVLGTSIKNFL